MKLSKPPALATWFVEHSTRGSKSEALAGDLLEQFSEGRSVAWYWRQALVATLVGFGKEWDIPVRAALVTTVLFWAANHVNGGHYWNSVAARSFFGLGNSRPWLMSLILVTVSFTSHSLVVLSYALAIHSPMMLAHYGAAVRLFTKEKRRRGWLLIGRPLLRGYLAVVLGTFLTLLALLPAQRHPVLVGNIVGWLPAFFAMIVVMWSERRLIWLWWT